MSNFLKSIPDEEISKTISELKQLGASESDVLEYQTKAFKHNENVKSSTKAAEPKTGTFQNLVEATALAADTIPSMVVGGATGCCCWRYWQRFCSRNSYGFWKSERI